MKFLLSMVLLVAPLSATAAPLFIEGATTFDSKGNKSKTVTIVVDKGVIKAMGKKLKAPAGAKVIKAQGMVVTPGLIDAASRIGMSEVEAEGSTVEGSFSSNIHASYRAADGYNPDSMAIAIVRKGGVTSAAVLPSGGLLAGQSTLVALSSDYTAPRAESVGVVATLGSRGRREGDGSRGQALARLREILDDARHYAANKASFDRNQARRYAASRLDLEALQPVLARRQRLWIKVHRRSDILAVLRMAKEERIRVAVLGGTEAWTVGKELKAADVPVVLDPTENLPSDFDRLRVRDDAPRLLHEAGVSIAFSPMGSPSQSANLRQLAGVAASNGLSPKAALRAITQAPAELLGSKAGKLKVGAPADLVLWSGDPLEVRSLAKTVIINGEIESLRSHQSELLRRYRQLPAKAP
jgi:imidazolonepropionase-like amidohydrolase